MDTLDGPVEGGGAEVGGASEHVFLGILRVAEMFTRSLTQTLRPLRLTLSQYSVLRALRQTMADGLRCREVGDQLVSRDPDITRLLDRLEGRGFISRRRGEGSDRRVVRAQITQQGLELLEAADALVRDLHNRYLGHFGQQELGSFKALLQATVEPS